MSSSVHEAGQVGGRVVVVAVADRRGRRAEALAVVGIFLALSAVAAYALTHAGPLGWDEAVYTGQARSLVTSLPAPGWHIYRPPGLPLLGLLAGPFGFSDLSLRSLTAIFGISTIAFGWAMARRLWGVAPAIVVLLATIGSPIVVIQMGLFHNDLPSVGILLVLMILLWEQFESGHGPNRWLLAAAPLAAAAFSMRYGTLVAIAGIAVTAIVLWHRPMLGHRRLVGGTLGLALLLAAPHVVYALVITGSPLGVLRSAVDIADSTSPVVALGHYVRWLPGRIAGVVGSFVILLGLGAATVALAGGITGRSFSTRLRASVWLYVPAAITVVGLVLVSHAERRYMLFPLFLAFIAGGGGVAAVVSWFRAAADDRGRRWMADAAIIGLVVLVGGWAIFTAARRVHNDAEAASRLRWITDVGQVIKADAAGPCLTASTITPVIAWYSGCDAVHIRPSGAAALLRTPHEGPLYVLLTSQDANWVSAATTTAYRDVVTGPPLASLPAGSTTPDAELYRLRP